MYVLWLFLLYFLFGRFSLWLAQAAFLNNVNKCCVSFRVSQVTHLHYLQQPHTVCVCVCLLVVVLCTCGHAMFSMFFLLRVVLDGIRSDSRQQKQVAPCGVHSSLLKALGLSSLLFRHNNNNKCVTPDGHFNFLFQISHFAAFSETKTRRHQLGFPSLFSSIPPPSMLSLFVFVSVLWLFDGSRLHVAHMVGCI